MNAPWTELFQRYAEKQLTELNCPGMAVGLARRGEPIHFAPLGWRDVEARLPITPDTLFGLGSVGKSFTCVALLQLEEAGKLRLEEPVVRYLPEFRTPDPEATRAITLHHLMTHTAGLPGLPMTWWTAKGHILADPDLVGTPLRAMAEEAPWLRTPADFIGAMAEYPYQLIGAPGQVMNYSNEGYALLGFIVERVSQMGYREYITERIFRPAGMSRSTMLTDEVAGMENAATLYDRKQLEGGESQVCRSPVWWSDPVAYGAGDHTSTISEMLRYMEIFRTGGLVEGERILSEQSVQRMIHPHVQVLPGQGYGYGLMTTRDSHGITTIGHGGSWKGVSADVLLQPETGLTSVALTNLQGMPAAAMNRAALYAANGLPPETAPHLYNEYPVTAAGLLRYAGSYPSDEGAAGAIEVRVEEGKLVVTMNGQVRTARPVGEHLFTLPVPTGESPIFFHTEADGEVFALRLGARIRRRAAID